VKAGKNAIKVLKKKTTPSRLEKRSRNGSLMAASRVLCDLIMMLREKEEVLENT